MLGFAIPFKGYCGDAKTGVNVDRCIGPGACVEYIF